MTTKSKSKIINWGIIGLGNIANKFAQDILTIPDANLYAVAARSKERATFFAEKYNADKAYGGYKELAQDRKIDAVYIATPHALHNENTLLCLNHGIAVLCEKPFAMNLSEVKEMITCAKKNNTLLMEALWTYFLPHYKFLLEKLQHKTYGKILKLEADFGFYRAFNNDSRLFNKTMGGGSLLDIGIYPIFAALSTLGIPKQIEANATFFDNGADSSCNMIFHYNNEVKAFLKSTLLEDTPTEATFYCEAATIKLNGGFFMPTTVTITTKTKAETFDFTDKANGYKYEILHFNQLLREGKIESPIMSFDFSKKLISLLDEVRHIINLKY
jgi:predicted dehydrogenase